MRKNFWKIFIIVFVVSFIVNAAISYLWNNSNDSNWKWDVTSTVAVTSAIVVSFVLTDKKKV